jgi:hypothetical protein
MRIALARLAFSLGIMIGAFPASAGTEVDLCYDYGCAHHARLEFSAEELAQVGLELAGAADAEDERRRVARAIGRMYAIAALRTPIWRDWGRNAMEERALEGAMDCIDHSTNTDAFLRLLAAEGHLKFHQPGGRSQRFAFLVFGEHWTATLRESATGSAFAVDSWFFDPGKPPVVVSLERWKGGYDPADDKEPPP